MEIICPICGYDGAYFDGVAFFCPDCGHKWSGRLKTAEEREAKEDEEFNKYCELQKIKKESEERNKLKNDKLKNGKKGNEK
jgi:uncharacterized Zn ribbon protein